jgi:hypothetical protein
MTGPGSGQEILEIEVRGKWGVGFCKSMAGAVRSCQRLFNRPKLKRGMQARNRSRINPNPIPPDELPEPTDKVFPGDYLRLFNRILTKSNLKLDNMRTAYSLRHASIRLRLMEGPIYIRARRISECVVERVALQSTEMSKIICRICD